MIQILSLLFEPFTRRLLTLLHGGFPFPDRVISH